MTDFHPMPFIPKSASDALALEIAASFRDLARLPIYREICSAHDHAFLRRILKETMKTPAYKIKKSRRALFIYLLRKYEPQDKPHRR